MQSAIVKNSDYIKDKDKYSELMVLKSGAGYYIGTIYYNQMGYEEPGSRDTEYFGSYEEADLYLKKLEKLEEEDAHFFLRQNP